MVLDPECPYPVQSGLYQKDESTYKYPSRTRKPPPHATEAKPGSGFIWMKDMNKGLLVLNHLGQEIPVAQETSKSRIGQRVPVKRDATAH